MTPQELLNANGISLPDYKPGIQYRTCLKCSHARKTEVHRNAKILRVVIDERGACWVCKHCGWKGPEKGNGHDRAHSPALKTHPYGPTLRKVRNPNWTEGSAKPKFFWQHLNRAGTWEKGTGGANTSALLYRLDEVTEAIANGHAIAVVEGESDVDCLWRLGVPATCNAHGASEPSKAPKWTEKHSAQLRGADVVVFQDNDPAGHAHADAVCRLSIGVARRVRRLGNMPAGKDVRAWVELDHTREELDALIAKATHYYVREQEQPRLIKSSAEFVAGYVPPDYVLDGMLQQGFLYSFTGATGAGKTSITLRLAANTALGTLFAGRETKKGRVLILAAENPDDVRMKWIALGPHMGFDPNTIDVFFSDHRFTISQMMPTLRAELERLGGEFVLVIIDTGPAFFEGDDESNRAQMGVHARMFRSLINVIPGRPCIIVNCHPVKNATADNLLPAGGGTFLNEMDGNLTAAKTESTAEVHWQGKFRGVEFAPLHFLIKTITHPDLKDRKGKLIPTCMCEFISDQASEEIAAQRTADENRVLEMISVNPKVTQVSIAIAMSWKLFNGEPNKMRAKRVVDDLKKGKLIKKTRNGRHILTPEGKKALGDEGDD